jgi:glycosyltransferase involved in cell wall biosynthesis
MEVSFAPKRVLFAYRSDVDLRGGAAVMLADLADALRSMGVEVDISTEYEPDPTGYDAVHVFNIWTPNTAMRQLRHLRAFDVPIIWNPIYSHWAEVAWARRAIDGIFRIADGPERQSYLDALAKGDLDAGGFTRWRFNEIIPGFHELLRDMLECVDHVLVFSSREMQMLSQVTRLAHKPFSVVPHGVALETVDAASADDFRAHTGIDGPFVLCVGTLNLHKNQLMIVEALKGTGVKLVLVGSCLEAGYKEMCLLEGGDGVVHFDHLPRELVAGAYKAADAHILASFAEGAAQVNLEAAAAGCPIVVSNRSSEYEYFGDHAFYCDPTSPDSIREATLAALDGRRSDPHRWSSLSECVREHTWERAARVVLSAYERAAASRVRIARQAARDRTEMESKAILVAASVEEVLAQPELLEAWCREFTADDPVTLALCASELTPDEAVARLSASGAAQALDRPDAPDVLVVGVADADLFDAADCLYGNVIGVDTSLPRFGPSELGALRAHCDESRKRAWATPSDGDSVTSARSASKPRRLAAAAHADLAA